MIPICWFLISDKNKNSKDFFIKNICSFYKAKDTFIYTFIIDKFLHKKHIRYKSYLVWFLCLMVYQFSWVISCQSHSCRSAEVVLFNPRLVDRVFANGLGDLGSVPGRIIPKTLKMVLDTSLLNTQ